MQRYATIAVSAFALAFCTAAAHAQYSGPLANIGDNVLQQAQIEPPAPVSFWAPTCGVEGFGTAEGWSADRHPRFIIDVTADRRADVVGFNDDGVYVAVSNGTGFDAPRRWIQDFGAQSGWRMDLHERTMADVNNDGRADIVGFGNEGVYVALSDGRNFGPTQLWLANMGANQGWRRVGAITNTEGTSDGYMGPHHIRMTADVNGDGRQDVVGFGDHGVWVALSTGTRFAALRMVVADFGHAQGWAVYQSQFTGAMLLSDRVRTMADVNGDRRADIVAFGADGVYVALARGLRFDPPQRRLTVFGADTRWNGTHVRTTADINGDARADLVGIFDNGVYTALADGAGGFTLTPGFTLTGFGADSGWRWPHTHPRSFPDFNGDGRADFVGFGDDGVWTALSAGSYHMTNPVFSLAAFGFNPGAGQWRPSTPRLTPDINGDGRADIAGFAPNCVMVSIAG